MRDPYEVLGVAKNASAKDIKSAYRKLAKKHHPDQNPNDPKAKDRFAAANQAYEILGDEKNRARLRPRRDRRRRQAELPGLRRRAAAAIPSPVSAAQAPRGRAASVSNSARARRRSVRRRRDIFSEIFGAGLFAARRRRARAAAAPAGARCQRDARRHRRGSRDRARKSPRMFPDGRKIAVKLPAYVEDGQTIRLKGQGEQGPGGAGDALVKIHIRRHPRYRVEGRDLHVDLPVPLKDAVLGAKVAVETPTGRLAVNVPAWSSSDKVLRLKGRGLPEKTGGHGDLYAHVRVMLPEGGDPELEALMRKRARLNRDSADRASVQPLEGAMCLCDRAAAANRVAENPTWRVVRA